MALTIASFTLSCSVQAGESKSAQASEQTTPTEEAKVIMLTKAEFLKRVANFEEQPSEWIYLGDKPCVIDFYATWCPPCKRVAPILEELAKEYAGKVYFYKIDVDKEQELTGAFGIESMPTFFFCPMEGEPQAAQGAMPKETFIKAIDEYLMK